MSLPLFSSLFLSVLLPSRLRFLLLYMSYSSEDAKIQFARQGSHQFLELNLRLKAHVILSVSVLLRFPMLSFEYFCTVLLPGLKK